MLALEHDLFLGDFEEAWWAEWGAEGEECEGRVLCFSVLAVEDFYSAADVEAL